MADGYYGQPRKRISEFWHLPEEEEMKHVEGKAYVLPGYVNTNLNGIESRLKSGGELTSTELHEYFHYLDHLSGSIRDILTLEKTEGVSNLNLERDFRRIGQLLNQVSAILDRH